MKRTRNLLAYVDTWIQIYGQRLAFQDNQWPQEILTRPVDVMRLDPKITEGGRTSAGRYLGACYRSSKGERPYVFLNVRAHRSRPHLRGTIAHELCHVRFPYLSHGSDFNKKIKQVMAGETFKPYKPKK